MNNNNNKSDKSRYTHIEVFDNETQEMLKEFAQTSPDLVQDIIDSFEPEASVLIAEIRESVEKKDKTGLQKAVHALAGISGSIGAKKLEMVSRDTDKLIKSNSMDQAYSLAEEILFAYDELIASLDKILR